MPRIHQFIFVVSLLALSWIAMMAVHELGHVIGAVATGGHVERVILHPLTISRTDVSPNPSPLIVVWLGPILGCLIPVVIAIATPRRFRRLRNTALFFTGFCLIANGAYLAFGSVDGVGDCGVMLQNGSPLWALIVFGAITIPLGFYFWHSLGSVKRFLANPTYVDSTMAYSLLTVLFVLLVFEFAFSAR